MSFKVTFAVNLILFGLSTIVNIQLQDKIQKSSFASHPTWGGAVRFLVVGTIGSEERPPRCQLWMEQCLTLLKYWPI